jgi:hypothetical protein
MAACSSLVRGAFNHAFCLFLKSITLLIIKLDRNMGMTVTRGVMAQKSNKKIRNIRKRGKDRLVKVNDQLNALTWDLSERNIVLEDSNTKQAVEILDQALHLIQEAGALLNSVSVSAATDMASDMAPVAATTPRSPAPTPATPTATSSGPVEAASPSAKVEAVKPTRPITAPTSNTAKQRSAAAKTSAPPVATLKT